MTPPSVKKERLIKTLEGSNWNIRATARNLGIAASTVRQLMARYEIPNKKKFITYMCNGCERLILIPPQKPQKDDIDDFCCPGEVTYKYFKRETAESTNDLGGKWIRDKS